MAEIVTWLLVIIKYVIICAMAKIVTRLLAIVKHVKFVS